MDSAKGVRECYLRQQAGAGFIFRKSIYILRLYLVYFDGMLVSIIWDRFGGELELPNIKSVAKDVKKSRMNRLRNQDTKSKIKTFVKKTKAAVQTEPKEVVLKLASETCSVIDKAAERGIIHKNQAARRKSRLMKALNKTPA